MLSFLTRVAYDNEILHPKKKKKKRVILDLYASILGGDIFFEDGGCDLEGVNSGI